MQTALNIHLFTLILLQVVSLLPISETGPPVPVEFWKELYGMNSSEFIEKYVKQQSNKEHYSEREEIQEGSAPDNVVASPRNDAVVPCYPMNSSVEVPVDPNPSVVRIPPCTVLPRCGGCCGSVPAIKCLPTSTKTVDVSVFRGVFDGNEFKFTQETLSMDAHTACGCTCSIKPSDCNSEIHIYDSSECSCRCRNENQANNCVFPKKWDEKSCSCVCQHLQNCLEDEVFSFKTCTCQSQTSQRLENAERAVSPCSLLTCKPGYKAVLLSGSCVCRPNPPPAIPRSMLRNFPFSLPDKRK